MPINMIGSVLRVSKLTGHIAGMAGKHPVNWITLNERKELNDHEKKDNSSFMQYGYARIDGKHGICTG